MAGREVKRVLTRGRGAWFDEGGEEMRSEGRAACLLKARRRPSQICIASPSTLDPTRLVRSSPHTCCALPYLPDYTFVTLHEPGKFSGPFYSDHALDSSLTYSVARDARPTRARAGALKQATSESPFKSPPYLNIKLPDLSAPPPETEVHIVGDTVIRLSSEICSKK